jgi:hypothetical protein
MLVRCNKADDPRCRAMRWECEHRLDHDMIFACRGGNGFPSRETCPFDKTLRVRCVKVKEEKKT